MALLRAPNLALGSQEQVKASRNPGPGNNPGTAGGGREPDFCVSFPPLPAKCSASSLSSESSELAALLGGDRVQRRKEDV